LYDQHFYIPGWKAGWFCHIFDKPDENMMTGIKRMQAMKTGSSAFLGGGTAE